MRPTRRRLAVRRTSDQQLVAAIEFVSPGNKRSVREFGVLVDKAVAFLRDGVHVFIIDPFPPTRRDPNGIHGAVWRQLTRERYERPADKPLTLAAYASQGEDRCLAFVNPLAVGDRRPDMPLFLAPDWSVNIPLEATYAEAWRVFPGERKPRVEGGGG